MSKSSSPHAAILCCVCLFALDATAGEFTGSGELGLAASRGNSKSENVNAKLELALEQERWSHGFFASALRAKGESTGDFDGDGTVEERFTTTANRFELGASSAFRFNGHSYLIGSLRYENDDFAPFENQATASLNYGYTFIDSEATRLSAEAGPGLRRAELADGSSESELIARAAVKYRQQLTETTQLENNLLVESGSDNTFIQNFVGVSVAINQALALKAGLEARHNTDVQPGVDKTDTQTTLNLVYNFK
jgi:putative salt-induced outer membrane protein